MQLTPKLLVELPVICCPFGAASLTQEFDENGISEPFVSRKSQQGRAEEISITRARSEFPFASEHVTFCTVCTVSADRAAEVWLGLVGIERVRRHSHHRNRSAPKWGVSTVPALIGSGSPFDSRLNGQAAILSVFAIFRNSDTIPDSDDRGIEQSARCRM